MKTYSLLYTALIALLFANPVLAQSDGVQVQGQQAQECEPGEEFTVDSLRGDREVIMRCGPDGLDSYKVETCDPGEDANFVFENDRSYYICGEKENNSIDGFGYMVLGLGSLILVGTGYFLGKKRN